MNMGQSFHTKPTKYSKPSSIVLFHFLQLGMKLRVCGAELGGGGPPGEPLEVEGVSHLLLHHNSCSPVPWDERLGLCARLRVMPLRALPDVHAHGGGVLATMVVVRCR